MHHEDGCKLKFMSVVLPNKIGGWLRARATRLDNLHLKREYELISARFMNVLLKSQRMGSVEDLILCYVVVCVDFISVVISLSSGSDAPSSLLFYNENKLCVVKWDDVCLSDLLGLVDLMVAARKRNILSQITHDVG
ncbi:hypothetical protein Tco_0604611, partial [Tanacetum coccineum]